MRVREIADLVGGELFGDGEVEITSVGNIEAAQKGQLVFFEKAGDLPQTNASCIIVAANDGSQNAEARAVESVPVIVVSDPKLAFAIAAGKIISKNDRQGWHETVVISPENKSTDSIRAAFIGAHVSIGDGSTISDGAVIHEGVRIGRNVSIGKFTIIHPNCVIYDDASIGNDCVIHAGVVIGADGFGYVRDGSGEYHKFPQIGTVVIEDKVEIGANTCVDRGALGETRIGQGTKIDNLVQVGHNVQIGKRCVIAAQTGISGSVVIEDDCVIGGQVGFGDHIRVQSGAVIGSQAGILPGKIVRPGVWWGTPIQPLDEYKRQNAHVKGLGRLKEEVKEIKRQLSALLNRE